MPSPDGSGILFIAWILPGFYQNAYAIKRYSVQPEHAPEKENSN